MRFYAIHMQNFQFLFKTAKHCIKCHIITDLSYQSYSLLCHLLHHSIYAYVHMYKLSTAALYVGFSHEPRVLAYCGDRVTDWSQSQTVTQQRSETNCNRALAWICWNKKYTPCCMSCFPMDIAVLIPMWNSQKKSQEWGVFLIEYTYGNRKSSFLITVIARSYIIVHQQLVKYEHS